jgi:superfamily II DNA or RNA helicase
MRRNAELYRSKNALHCKNLKIELKAFTKLRDYQSEALKAVVKDVMR